MAVGGSSLGRDKRTLGALVVLLLGVFAVIDGANAQLAVGFYKDTCPKAETIITAAVVANFILDRHAAPGLLRMHFHDCFVRGCDGSVLIDGAGTEKTGVANLGTLRDSAFQTVDNAKAALEVACPGVVSCADILAYAARDSVAITGGLSWSVEAGRRDGRQSSSKDLTSLPPPVFQVDQLTSLFQTKGLSQDEMVTLSGGHTIGQAHCSAFAGRINASNPDPSLDAKYAQELAVLCPPNAPNTTRVDMESTPNRFDTRYYSELLNHRGLFTSDQALADTAATRPAVINNANNPSAFRDKFAKAMVHMGQIGVLTGSQGEIRKNCRVINS